MTTDAKFLQAMRDAGLPEASPALPTAETATPVAIVRRYVDRKTGEAVPHVRTVHLGRNDPCPCGCGKKAKRCERGVELIEKGRWA